MLHLLEINDHFLALVSIQLRLVGGGPFFDFGYGVLGVGLTIPWDGLGQGGVIQIFPRVRIRWVGVVYH
jgi:hypothetical protein